MTTIHLLIIGTGYVGLVTGACLAERGHHVTCLDINTSKIKGLLQGIIPIYEPGLEELVLKNMQAGRLHFTADYKQALAETSLCFIAVDTPVGPDGQADLTQIRNVALSIGEHIQSDLLVVTKSTVPVGTGKMIFQLIQSQLESRNVYHEVSLVANPEFLKEGNAIQDFMYPDRVIIGSSELKAIKRMEEVYAPFNLEASQWIVMDVASAEITKYAANVMLATRISLMNELANLCEAIEGDIGKVSQGIGSDPRIGHSFLNAGAGYGGSCLPKDVRALRAHANAMGYPTAILDAIEEVNFKQKRLLGEKISDYFQALGGVEGKRIGILGLSFKPNTDDMREASSLVLMNQLLKQGAILQVFDPVAMKNAQVFFQEEIRIRWCENELEVSKDADAVALITEWPQFKRLDFALMLSLMQGNAFFDGRNLLLPEQMASLGFHYISMGRPTLPIRALSSNRSL